MLQGQLLRCKAEHGRWMSEHVLLIPINEGLVNMDA